MKWEEMSKEYEKEKKSSQSLNNFSKFDRHWSNLVKSTDKLMYLFLMSTSNTNRIKTFNQN
jgi:hypothetical protein